VNRRAAMMHELAITQSVVEMVQQRTGDRRVSTVRLQVGLLSGVVPEAMQFCYELVTAGTPLEGSLLEFDQTPGRGQCRDCGADFELGDLILLCSCGSADVELVAGKELRVIAVEMEAQPCA
jgi:hydrogenase nickel incorporation protein HypA/HybF